jgi:hypothetical protein
MLRQEDQEFQASLGYLTRLYLKKHFFFFFFEILGIELRALSFLGKTLLPSPCPPSREKL